MIQLTGEAQGTTYQVKFLSDDTASFTHELDSIFRMVDRSMSTYLDGSLINRINNNDSTAIPDSHFIRVFRRAWKIAELTGGYFDPTVMPLVKRWKISNSDTARFSIPDRSEIDSILQFTGYKKVYLDNNRIIKADQRVQLDFSGIAQGYTVDLIAAFLESRGITDYMVEIGGEVRAKGKNDRREYWRIGIDDPQVQPDERKIIKVIELRDRALATSGIYRKFKTVNGKKISHIINPLTGHSVFSNLLSVSVIAGDCMTADALATGLLVMGEEKAKEFLRKNYNIHVMLIYSIEDIGIEVYGTDSIKNWLLQQ